jgi:hypothetical protein
VPWAALGVIVCSLNGSEVKHYRGLCHCLVLDIDPGIVHHDHRRDPGRWGAILRLKAFAAAFHTQMNAIE